MKRRILYGLCLASTFAVALLLLCYRMRHDNTGLRSAMPAHSVTLPKTDSKLTVESVKEAIMRLKVSDMTDSAEIAGEMLEGLSSTQNISVRREDVVDLLGIAEELEARQILLSNGVSVAARDFARLEGDDFKSAVNALCSLRLFCAKASARLEGVGDVSSELWLVQFLTRAKTHLAKYGMTERQELIDSWLDTVWTFVDSRECNAYKATRKLWDDGLVHVFTRDANNEYFRAFVDQVRKSFIDPMCKMGGGHIVPWSVEFTVDSGRR